MIKLLILHNLLEFTNEVKHIPNFCQLWSSPSVAERDFFVSHVSVNTVRCEISCCTCRITNRLNCACAKPFPGLPDRVGLTLKWETYFGSILRLVWFRLSTVCWWSLFRLISLGPTEMWIPYHYEHPLLHRDSNSALIDWVIRALTIRPLVGHLQGINWSNKCNNEYNSKFQY